VGKLVEKRIASARGEVGIDKIVANGEKLHLKKRILVYIYATDGVIRVAEEDIFNVEGIGGTIGEALEGMNSLILEELYNLRDIPLDDMSPEEREKYRLAEW